ncbi:hypothetical protein Dimus_004521 [Dionaea muscipula]
MSVGGPDLMIYPRRHPDSNKCGLPPHSSNTILISDKVHKAKEEWQDRRSRSDAPAEKPEQRRPASLDLDTSLCSNVVNLSPRFSGAMRKGPAPVSSRKSSNFPSPGTPNYHHGNVGVNKGWSSERVPLPTNGNRRQAGLAALHPFNAGRTLPSKWEDAERWIFSPAVAGDGVMRTSNQQLQRRPKSKSGPLGPPGIAYYLQYSPAAPLYYDGNQVGHFVAASPFSAGVIGADGFSLRAGGDDGAFQCKADPCIARSASVHGCTDLICQSSVATSQDEKADDFQDTTATDISRAVSRRDMATQMSPARSSRSSPKRRSSCSSATPSVLQIVEPRNSNSSSAKAEVRDVQVDERVTVTRWSKKHKSKIPGRASDDVDDWKLKAVEAHSSSWEVSETAKNISKAKREEAKITAWENLQKAKAEAAISKLEMKLEKKRSSSMDKIMNKLRSAQKKAQEMRSAVLANEAPKVPKVSHKVVISSRRTRQIGSLTSCFTCHAF